MALQVEEIGLLRLVEVEVVRLVVLVAGVAEEHQLTVVSPLWKVKVL